VAFDTDETQDICTVFVYFACHKANALTRRLTEIEQDMKSSVCYDNCTHTTCLANHTTTQTELTAKSLLKQMTISVQLLVINKDVLV
jgi:hypothetical protein